MLLIVGYTHDLLYNCHMTSLILYIDQAGNDDDPDNGNDDDPDNNSQGNLGILNNIIIMFLIYRSSCR